MTGVMTSLGEPFGITPDFEVNKDEQVFQASLLNCFVSPHKPHLQEGVWENLNEEGKGCVRWGYPVLSG